MGGDLGLQGGGGSSLLFRGSSLVFRGRPRAREAAQFTRLGTGTGTGTSTSKGSSFTGATWEDGFSSGCSSGAGSAAMRTAGGEGWGLQR